MAVTALTTAKCAKCGASGPQFLQMVYHNRIANTIPVAGQSDDGTATGDEWTRAPMSCFPPVDEAMTVSHDFGQEPEAADPLLPPAEHLHFTCTLCGHQWPEPPLDARTAGDEAGRNARDAADPPPGISAY